jgi:hypothetical protein
MPLDDWPRGSAAQSTTWRSDMCSSTSSELPMRRKVPQILFRTYRKWKTDTSLTEWMM